MGRHEESWPAREPAALLSHASGRGKGVSPVAVGARLFRRQRPSERGATVRSFQNIYTIQPRGPQGVTNADGLVSVVAGTKLSELCGLT